MMCPSCGTAAQPGQKFCTECGAMLAPVAVAQPFADAPPNPAAGLSYPPPHLAPPAASSLSAPPAGLYGATAALNVVEQTAPTGYEPNGWSTAATGEMPVQGGDTGQVPVVQPFRITPLLAVAALAGVLAVASAVVDVASVEVEGDFASEQVYRLNDFASNLTVAAVIAALLLVGGAVLGVTGRRVGTGLAGGAGLALAGMSAWVAGTVIALFDSQEVFLLGGGGSFTLTTTQEVGFWLAVAAGGLGVLVFLLSLASAGNDGRRAINPAIGVLGALGTLAVVVGPLIPMNGAALGDNFSNELLPPATLYLRLAVLALIGIGGFVGFLANRRWGIGVALGSISVGAWEWMTALGKSGDIPLGIAGGNPGATDFAPHIVTSVGVIVMLLAGVAGLVVAAQQRDVR